MAPGGVDDVNIGIDVDAEQVPATINKMGATAEARIQGLVAELKALADAGVPATGIAARAGQVASEVRTTATTSTKLGATPPWQLTGEKEGAWRTRIGNEVRSAYVSAAGNLAGDAKKAFDSEVNKTRDRINREFRAGVPSNYEQAQIYNQQAAVRLKSPTPISDGGVQREIEASRQRLLRAAQLGNVTAAEAEQLHREIFNLAQATGSTLPPQLARVEATARSQRRGSVILGPDGKPIVQDDVRALAVENAWGKMAGRATGSERERQLLRIQELSKQLGILGPTELGAHRNLLRDTRLSNEDAATNTAKAASVEWAESQHRAALALNGTTAITDRAEAARLAAMTADERQAEASKLYEAATKDAAVKLLKFGMLDEHGIATRGGADAAEHTAGMQVGAFRDLDLATDPRLRALVDQRTIAADTLRRAQNSGTSDEAILAKAQADLAEADRRLAVKVRELGLLTEEQIAAGAIKKNLERDVGARGTIAATESRTAAQTGTLAQAEMAKVTDKTEINAQLATAQAETLREVTAAARFWEAQVAAQKAIAQETLLADTAYVKATYLAADAREATARLNRDARSAAIAANPEAEGATRARRDVANAAANAARDRALLEDSSDLGVLKAERAARTARVAALEDGTSAEITESRVIRRRAGLEQARADAELEGAITGRKLTPSMRFSSGVSNIFNPGERKSPYQFSSIGENIGWQLPRTIGYAASGALLYGGISGLRTMLDNATELQQQLVLLKGQFRAAEQAGADFGDLTFDKLKENIQDISVETGANTSEVVQTTKRLAGAFAGEDGIPQYAGKRGALKQTETAMWISKITGIPVKETTDDLVALAVAFHTNFDQIGDDVAALSDRMGVDGSEIVAFAARLAPVAASMGFTSKQVMALGALGNQVYGGSGATLASSVTGVFAKLTQDPDKLLSVFADNSGTADMVDEMSKAIANNNMKQVMLLLARGWDKLPTGAQKEIEDLSGGRVEAAGFYSMIGRPKLLEQNLGYNKDNTGALDERKKEYVKSLQFQFDKLSQTIDKVGQALLKSGLQQVLGDSAQAGAKLAGALEVIATIFGDLNDLTKGFVGQLVMAVALGKTLSFAVGAWKNRGLSVTEDLGNGVTRTAKGRGARRVLAEAGAEAGAGSTAAAAAGSEAVAAATAAESQALTRARIASIELETELAIASIRAEGAVGADQLTAAELRARAAVNEARILDAEKSAAAQIAAIEASSAVSTTAGAASGAVGRAGLLGRMGGGLKGIGKAILNPTNVALLGITAGLATYGKISEVTDQNWEDSRKTVGGAVQAKMAKGDATPAEIIAAAKRATRDRSFGDIVRNSLGQDTWQDMSLKSVYAALAPATEKADDQLLTRVGKSKTNRTELAKELLKAQGKPTVAPASLTYRGYVESDAPTPQEQLASDPEFMAKFKADLAKGDQKSRDAWNKYLAGHKGANRQYQVLLKDFDSQSTKGKKLIVEGILGDAAKDASSYELLVQQFESGSKGLDDLRKATDDAIRLAEKNADNFHKAGRPVDEAKERKRILDMRQYRSSAITGIQDDRLNLMGVSNSVSGGGSDQEYGNTVETKLNVIRDKDATFKDKTDAALAIIEAGRKRFDDWVNSASSEGEKQSRADQGMDVNPIARKLVVRDSFIKADESTKKKIKRIAEAMGKSQGAVRTLFVNQVTEGTDSQLEAFRAELRGEIEFERAAIEVMQKRLQKLGNSGFAGLSQAFELGGKIKEAQVRLMNALSMLDDVDTAGEAGIDTGPKYKGTGASPEQAAANARQRNLSMAQGQAAIAKAMAHGDSVGEAQADLAAANAAIQFADPGDDGAMAQLRANQISAINAVNDAIRDRARKFAEGRIAIAKAMANGDPLKEAQADLESAQLALQYAKPEDYDAATAQVISAQNQIARVQEDISMAHLEYQASQHDDPVQQARDRLQMATQAVSNARGDAEKSRAMAQQAQAQRELDAALNDVITSKLQYAAVLSQGDAVAVAQAQLQIANNAVDNAKGEAAKWQALGQQIQAQRALAQAVLDIAVAQQELGIAVANANGDVIAAAQAQVEIARMRLEQARQDGAGEAELMRLQAQLVNATANLTQTRLNEQMENMEYLFRTEQITASQLIDFLEMQLAQIPESNTRLRRQIQERIYQLRKDMSGDMNWNLPSEIRLPSLYEARRLNQTNNNSSYQDNRVFDISVTTAATARDVQNILAEAVGSPPTSGSGYAPFGVG